MLTEQIGFIGAGQMARALAEGFVRAELVEAAQIHVADIAPVAVNDFCRRVPGSRPERSNSAVLDAADVVFIAVKPQHLESAFAEARVSARPRHEVLLVSIVAGAPLARLSALAASERVIRVMPNTPCLVGLGASAFCRGAGAKPEDANLVQRLLSAVGWAVELGEHLLDAVTGLSGSGPAFVYQFLEALADGGVRVGLPRDVAQQLATQTVLGAATMVQQSGEHPAVLKDRVASPGGTTIAGLHALEQGGLRAAVIGAVQAATERSRELGRTTN